MPYSPDRHGPRRLVGPGFHARVHAAVHTVPAGRVATYGTIARLLGSVGIARHVGRALAALPAASDVPWWRIVAANGRLACVDPASQREQIRRLRHEGLGVARGHVVAFDEHEHRVDGVP